MIHMIVEICIIDERPIELSPVYDVLVREYGEEFANRWIKEVVIPPVEMVH